MEALYHVRMSSLLSQSHAGRQVNLESNPDADLPFSLLERVVPGLPAELEAACLSEPDLVPYRMRQAIGQQLGRRQIGWRTPSRVHHQWLGRARRQLLIGRNCHGG